MERVRERQKKNENQKKKKQRKVRIKRVKRKAREPACHLCLSRTHEIANLVCVFIRMGAL